MRLLDQIRTPNDLKQIPIRQLPSLAQDMRQELLSVISHLGGHLASSLGAMELCVALHYVFDAPTDKLVWDMGYQAYGHKMLTGRRDRIHTLKQFRGLTGFNNKNESPYDLFTTGHGGTCLSTAMGLALARDLPAPRDGEEGVARQAGRTQQRHQVVAILGDASLGEGMALEALNHIGHVKPNMVVILNDNKMSIATPVGGLSRCLNRMITNPLYNRLRADLKGLVEHHLPKGKKLVRLGDRMQESLKGFLVPGLLFEELGLRYVGPIDGHNLPELIATLKNVKRLKGPILLHVLTTKGKGYTPAEQDPETFHKIEAFDLATGAVKAQGPKAKAAGNGSKPRAPAFTASTSFTDAFTSTLLELAEQDSRIMAITAAMPEGTGVAEFGRRFPDRYFDVGMAEQHGVGLAAGLARAGQKPIVAMYSTFLQRAYDQIMHEVSLQELPVIFAIDRGGLVGEDGPTHHGVFDLTYLRAFPNLVVLSPKDPEELRQMLRWAADAQRPVAIRYSRGGIVCGEPLGRGARVSFGRAEVLQEGRDLGIFALGSMVYPALEVANRLRQQGVEATVVNARFAKPLDRAAIRQLANQTSAIVTIEEGQLAGGFGSAVSETLEALGFTQVPLHRIALPDQYVEHGTRAQLLKLCQLDADGLTRRIATWWTTLKLSIDDARLLAEPS